MVQGKAHWQKRFRDVGIEPAQIMNEIWRAHYVDQLLFSNPVNKAYGVDETVIYQAAQQTQDRFGAVAGDAQDYIRVYGTAMAAPAHLFAPRRQWKRAAALQAWWRLWGEGKTALLWHADRILDELKDADSVFGIGRVFGLADGADTAHRWQAVYPQVRWVTREELGAQRFGYIHVVGDEAQALADWREACGYLADGGVATAMVKWETLDEGESLPEALCLTERVAGNWPRIWLVHGTTPGIGAAAYRSGSWHIDRDNASARRYLAPQNELRIGTLATPVSPAGVTRTDVLWADDAQVGNEYLGAPTGQERRRGVVLQAGDIVVAPHGDSYRVALVPREYPPAATALTVLRPLTPEKGRQLFGSLLQEATRRRLAAVAQTEKTPLEDCVWEWLPLPEPLPTEAQLQRLEDTLHAMAQMRRAWQTAVADE